MSRYGLRLAIGTAVAVFIAVIAFPAATKAAQFLGVYITDPTDATRQASVNAAGALHVFGTVAARPTLASTSLVDTVSLDSAHAGGSPAAMVFGHLFSATQKVAITSLTVTNMLENDLISFIVIEAQQPITGECGGVGGEAFSAGPNIYINVGAQATQHLDFPYPLVYPTGSPSGDWCVRAFAFGSGRQVAVTAVGYVQ